MASPTVIDAAWTFDDQNTAQNGRYVVGSLFLNSAAATAANSVWRDGVVPGPYSSSASTYLSYRVTQNSPTGSSVLVQPGHAIVTRTGQGVYVCPNSTARVVALDAADATNPRIDLIVLQVLDQPLGDSVTQAQVRAVTGTPSGSPVAPATPTGAIVLAQVAVAAAPTGNTIVDANITDKRKTTGLNGAVRPLLPGDSTADAGVEGDIRYQAGLYERYTVSGGGKWVPFAQTNGPLGYVSSATYNTNGGASPGGTPGVEVVGRSHTFTALANRRYRVTWRVGVYSDSASNMNLRTRWASGGSVTITDTETSIELHRHYVGGQVASALMVASFPGPSSAGSITVGMTAQNLDNLGVGVFGSSINVNTVLVEDIGGV